jgi:hypothetical protein
MSRQRLLCLVFVLLLAPPTSFGAGQPWPLPDLNALSGWRQAENLQPYNHDNLYEYIDGDAETFFAYGFQGLAVAKYANAAQKLSLTIDLYDMGKPLNAFGVYANGRSPDVQFADVGAQAYFGESSLDFWKGKFYVHIYSKQDAPSVKDALLAFGRNVAGRIEGAVGDPSETQLLPSEGRLQNSAKYQPQNALGQSFIPNALIADYDLGAAKAQLVVAQLPSDVEAKKALSKLRDYVKTSGAVTVGADDPSPESFFGNDPYYKNILATTSGPYLVCVLRAPDRQSAQELLDASLSHLSRK